MTPVTVRIHGSNHWRALLGGGFLVLLGLATIVFSVIEGFDGSLFASALFVLVLGGVPMYVVLRRQRFVRVDDDGYKIDGVEGHWADATEVRLVGAHIVLGGPEGRAYTLTVVPRDGAARHYSLGRLGSGGARLDRALMAACPAIYRGITRRNTLT